VVTKKRRAFSASVSVRWFGMRTTPGRYDIERWIDLSQLHFNWAHGMLSISMVLFSLPFHGEKYFIISIHPPSPLSPLWGAGLRTWILELRFGIRWDGG
jgi:hypothetical protein